MSKQKIKKASLTMKNEEGYADPTAYEAIKRVDSAKDREETVRFYDLLDTILYICKLAGFELEDRITLKDKKTGRIWK